MCKNLVAISKFEDHILAPWRPRKTLILNFPSGPGPGEATHRFLEFGTVPNELMTLEQTNMVIFRSG
jgi:hypothetical protein